MKRRQSLLLLLITLIFPAVADAQAWSGIISSSRATDWTHAGVVGGIPSASWTQCGSTIAAYTGSGAKITNALASCSPNTYVLLSPGTFTINSGGITFPTGGHVALRGSGANSTFLVIASGAGASGCQLGSCLIAATSADGTYGGNATYYGWTSGYSQGSNQITVSSTTGINTTNPTMLLLEQCETGFTASSATSSCTGSATDNNQLFVCSSLWTGVGCSNNGPGNQNALRGHLEMTYATGIAGSVITLADPLAHPDWTSGQTPRIWFVQPIVDVGVENLSIDDSSSATNDIIQFNSALNWWVSGVRLTNWGRWGVEVLTSEHGTVQNSYFYHTTGPDSYGFRLEVGGHNLIQNNIMTQIFAPVVLDGASSGDVIAYNYIINDNYHSDFMRGSLIGHDINDFELIEGNIVNNSGFSDGNHGTDSMTTHFRNFELGWDSCANGQCGSTTAKGAGTSGPNAMFGSRYSNFVANVVGTPGFTTIYESDASQFTAGVAFMLGGSNIFFADPLVYSTALMWGNWDVATGVIRWCGNVSDTGWSLTCGSVSEVPWNISPYPNAIPTKGDTVAGQPRMPASFYLPSQPSWWGSTAWPAIGPDVSSGNVGQCSGTLNTSGHQSGMPATSSSQCTGTSLTTGAYGGHVNANPAMACYTSMGGVPDGTGSVLAFDANTCYGGPSSSQSSQSSQAPQPPTNLVVVVN